MGWGGEGNDAMDNRDSLLFEQNCKTDKVELCRIALMSFTHCVTLWYNYI